MVSPKAAPRRLLIIHHANERGNGGRQHLMHAMLPVWKETGIEITEVFGLRDAPPADVALLHVDLSVIPPKYLKFARQYPVVINGEVTDIRKSRLSLLRIDPRSDYAGPVIVKSALNHAGTPEKLYFWQLSRLQRLFARNSPVPSYPMTLESKADYRIYATPDEVPVAVWDCADLVVEKFMPERHDGLYCLREWYFFGTQSMQRVELSSSPIFTSGELVHHLDIPVPPELHTLKARLGFDYGKFDFTMVDDRPAIFDFNKTPGVMDPHNKVIQNMARQLADGLEEFFSMMDNPSAWRLIANVRSSIWICA